MIGLDTNVIVRYLAQDDARQAAVAATPTITHARIAALSASATIVASRTGIHRLAGTRIREASGGFDHGGIKTFQEETSDRIARRLVPTRHSDW